MKLKYLLPLAIFIALTGFLFKGLYLDPRTIPSVLINKPMPTFALQTIDDPKKTLSKDDMLGKVWLMNVWATWCAPCKMEHKFFVELEKKGQLNVPMVGFVHRDTQVRAKRFLDYYGNPFTVSVFEEKNRIGMDLGITGVPETFIVDKKGVIRAKISYAIDERMWLEQVLPVVKVLETEE